MSILVDEQSRVLVQGITGREGQFHTEQMIRYGTRVVGGVTPGRGGQAVLGVPVFDTVREAVHATGADVSVAFVPAALAVLLALLLVPQGRLTWAPLENAADSLRNAFEDYFRFSEVRQTFSRNARMREMGSCPVPAA